MSFVELLAPILADARAPSENEASRRFCPWLEAHANPELREFNLALRTHAVRPGYRNALFPALTQTLSDVISAEEEAASRAARIRGLFLGMSPILYDREELWFATWAGTDFGTSQVWASHQDERDIWLAKHSLRDFVLAQYVEDSQFADELTLPPALRDVPPIATRSELPSNLEIARLFPRTHWIVALLFPEGDWYGIGDGMVAAPDYEVFERELALIAAWPNLQAYWLLHHFVFDNQEALAKVMPLVDTRYAPAADIAAICRGESSLPDMGAVHGLRATAATRYARVLEPATRARATTPLADLDKAFSDARATIADLPGNDLWDLLTASAGDLEEADKNGLRALVKDPDEQLAMMLLVKRGNAPALGWLLMSLAEKVDARWLDAARVGVRRGAPFADTHPRCHLGAITALGVALGDWGSFVAEIGEPERLGRYRRLAVAAAATRLPQAAARAFLRGEALRYLKALPASVTDTAELALFELLKARDAPTCAALEQAIRGAKNARATVQIVKAIVIAAAEPLLAGAFEAVIADAFGEQEKGEPVRLSRVFASFHPERARSYFARQNVSEQVVVEAATVAGLLQLAPTNADTRKRFAAVLSRLRPSKERECGLGLALLQAARELAVPETEEFIAQWQQAPLSKYASEELRAWFAGLHVDT